MPQVNYIRFSLPVTATHTFEVDSVSIANIASFGTSSGSPTRRVNDMVEVVSNLSYQTGGHAFRAGVDVLDGDARVHVPPGDVD